MEDTAEFKWAVKVVLRRQLQDLVNQLQETGDEIAIMTVNTSEDMYSHFGTSAGEWFISEQKNLTANFLHFCKSQNHRDGKKPTMAGTYENPIVYHPPSKKARKTATLSKSSSGSISSTPQKEITELLEVLIPEQMKQGISDIAIQSLVGRLVAIIIDKDSTAKDSVIPSLSRSGRKIKPKLIDDAGLTKPTPPEGQAILERLAYIDTQTLNRVQVKVGSGSFANVASTPIPTSEEMYPLAVAIMNDLILLEKHLLLRNKQLKVMVLGKANSSSVKVQVVKKSQAFHCNTAGTDGGNGIKHVNQTDGIDGGIDNDSDIGPSMISDEGTGNKSEHLYHISDETVTANKPKPFSNLSLAEKMERHNQRRSRNVRYRTLAKQGLKDCAKISCNQCNMKIAGYKNLKTHVEYMHLKIRNAVCKVCTKSFYKNHKLEVHNMDVHTRQCQACKQYVVETEPWKEGTNNRMVRSVPCECGEQVEVCSVFNRPKGTFTKRPRVNQIHACSTCGKVFPNGSRLRRHVKTHLDTFDFVCDLCGKAFRCKPSLNQHMKNEHAVFDSLNVCKICDRVYQSGHTLEIHMAKAHSSATPDTTYTIAQQPIPDSFGIPHTQMTAGTVNIAQNTNPGDNRQYNYANYGY